MPEIIDLEVARENMLKKVQGTAVRTVKVPSEKVLKNAIPPQLSSVIEGRSLDDISRTGKMLAFVFGDVSLVVHLMLHGDFCWGDGQSKEKNVVLELEFETGERILLKDWSQWAKVELHARSEGCTSDMMGSEYGVDPLGEEFSLAAFNEVLMNKKRSGIKAILMNQALISGIGNAYSDEILWDAAVHPKSTCSGIMNASISEKLWKSVRDVLKKSLDIVRDLSHGTEIHEQEREFMNVYRKSGSQCPRCGYMIACLKVVGRDTFVCEKCQITY